MSQERPKGKPLAKGDLLLLIPGLIPVFLGVLALRSSYVSQARVQTLERQPVIFRPAPRDPGRFIARTDDGMFERNVTEETKEFAELRDPYVYRTSSGEFRLLAGVQDRIALSLAALFIGLGLFWLAGAAASLNLKKGHGVLATSGGIFAGGGLSYLAYLRGFAAQGFAGQLVTVMPLLFIGGLGIAMAWRRHRKCRREERIISEVKGGSVSPPSSMDDVYAIKSAALAIEDDLAERIHSRFGDPPEAGEKQSPRPADRLRLQLLLDCLNGTLDEMNRPPTLRRIIGRVPDSPPRIGEVDRFEELRAVLSSDEADLLDRVLTAEAVIRRDGRYAEASRSE